MFVIGFWGRSCFAMAIFWAAISAVERAFQIGGADAWSSAMLRYIQLTSARRPVWCAGLFALFVPLYGKVIMR